MWPMWNGPFAYGSAVVTNSRRRGVDIRAWPLSTGAFFTDEQNTPYRGDVSGEDGEVPSVWLVNARANYTIPKTNAVVFVSAENLTDELYIVDREDGIKPGLGRSVMAGAKVRW